MEDGRPDWHLARSMGRHNGIAQNDLAYACRRKLPPIPPLQQSQIGHPGLQRGRCRTPSPAIRAMAHGAISLEQIRSFDRLDQRRKLRCRRLSPPAGYGRDDAGQCRRQHKLSEPLHQWHSFLSPGSIVVLRRTGHRSRPRDGKPSCEAERGGRSVSALSKISHR
jgi:hypothetical protein